MTMRIATKDLVGFLGDLLQTATDDPEQPSVHGVLVHTTRGHWGGDPGRVDLIAGISTDRHVIGHTYTTCSGQLGGGPMWWDRIDLLAVLAVLKPLAKKTEHAVELRLTDGGSFVVVEEDKDLFGDGVSVQFPTRDPSDFPGAGAYRYLAARPSGLFTDPGTGAEVDAVRRTDLAAVLLSPFLAIAKRRGVPCVQLYRAHQYRPVHVQVGEHYRGVLLAARFDYAEDGDHPTASIYAPEFPPGESEADRLEGEGVIVPHLDATKRPESDDPEQTAMPSDGESS